MHVVTRKLDLNQMSVAPTMLKNIDQTFSTERLYRWTEGLYWNISLLLVPCTDSLNSLTEALDNGPVCVDRCTRSWEKQEENNTVLWKGNWMKDAGCLENVHRFPPADLWFYQYLHNCVCVFSLQICKTPTDNKNTQINSVQLLLQCIKKQVITFRRRDLCKCII